MARKSEQLQIRVTPAQKAALRQYARKAGMDVSSYVLARALPGKRQRFQAIVRALAEADTPTFGLAELHDLLADLTSFELDDATEEDGIHELSPFLQCYVAAMVEEAAHRAGAPPPVWTRLIPPLSEPHFATLLPGLRLHLLQTSPLPFKRRNIFIDASVGARV